jgi:hypothetical protein
MSSVSRASRSVSAGADSGSEGYDMLVKMPEDFASMTYETTSILIPERAQWSVFIREHLQNMRWLPCSIWHSDALRKAGLNVLTDVSAARSVIDPRLC